MLDLSIHRSEELFSNWEVKKILLLRNVPQTLNEMPKWLTVELIDRAHSSSEDFFSFHCDALLVAWPKTHTSYILMCAAQLGHINMQCIANAGKELVLTFNDISLTYTPQPENSYHFSGQSVLEWFDAVSSNAILRNHKAVEDICQVNGEQLNLGRNTAWKSLESAFFAVFQLYFSSENDDCDKQRKAIAMVEPYLIEGAITKAQVTELETYEEEVHGIITPLYNLIKAIWNGDHNEVEMAVKAASQANYDCYAYSYPKRNGDESGEKSLENRAMFHYHIMGILAVYHDRTGKRLSFSNAYTPDWLIYGEGPNLEDISSSPPTFDLESVSVNQ